jgi:nitrate reductase (NAD(P)H)
MLTYKRSWKGFLTPTELFYVRNHGAVPHVQDNEVLSWEVSIEGLKIFSVFPNVRMVENPIKLTLEEIIRDFPQVTLPITLVCAGNRRKEQNEVRKGSGFNWGPAATSTSLFTGPLLGDILAVAKPFRKARYVWMEGADNLPKGHYGTSVLLRHAMDFEKGIMLSYKMNGEMLHPDHGRPLRVVVPGVIGGRSVKWLKRLIVADVPSDNYYHIYDNRVLPTVVTPEMAKTDKNWWKDERYAIYNLNVNSVIVHPAHDSEINLSIDMHECYTIKGYAYSGGGRRITRVEASLDKGRSWNLAQIIYPEDKFRNLPSSKLFGGILDMDSRDTCYCWCFWSMEVTYSDLHESNDIVVRAMDESMNAQPRDLYWNVMGMMNGSWFRVVIHKGSPGKLKFEHPTIPGLTPGGWMERVKQQGGDLQDGNWGETLTKCVGRKEQAEISLTNPEMNDEISMEEIAKHNKYGDSWFVVHGQVYNGTKFLNEHPGGAESIIMAAGSDATDDFMAIHSETAKKMMANYHIGRVKANVLPVPRGVATEDPLKPRATFLSPKAWQRSRIFKKYHVSPDTCVVEFELEHAEQYLGLPIGQHLFLRIKDENSQYVVRAYTPISGPSDKGMMRLLVKMYLPSKRYQGGKMTTLLNSIPEGQTVDIKGPLGGFEYLGRGRIRFHGVERKIEQFAMICAGSGITPIYQVLRAVVQDEVDTTTCVVVNGNRQEEDILCREDLDKWQLRKNVQIWYAVFGLKLTTGSH